eukprot:13884227-Ditylum_brightwellii.AAC.1
MRLWECEKRLVRGRLTVSYGVSEVSVETLRQQCIWADGVRVVVAVAPLFAVFDARAEPCSSDSSTVA